MNFIFSDSETVTQSKDKSENHMQTKVHLHLCEIRVEHLIWPPHQWAEGIFRTAVRSFMKDHLKTWKNVQFYVICRALTAKIWENP